MQRKEVVAGSGGEALSSFRISLRNIEGRRLKPAATICLCVFVCLCCILGQANGDNRAGELLDKMETAERNIQDARFNFEQTIHFNVTGETHTIKGEAMYKYPNKVFVKITEPVEQTAVSDGKLLWLYVKGRGQVVKDKWSNWSRAINFPEGMTPFNANAAAFRKKFQFDLEETGETDAAPGKYFVLRLVPKVKAKKTSPDYTLRVWVSPETYYIGKSELVTDGNKIEISIVDFKTNTGIAPETFRFTPPVGTEVINLLK